MNNKETFGVTPAPHIRGSLTTGSVMYAVILALLPAALYGISRFGAHALLIILTSVLTAMLTEYALDCFLGRGNTLRDGSAALTGLLLALTLPGDVPLYIPFAGALIAAVGVKGLFGGLGKNLLNPALAARCLLTMAFREQMAAKAAAAGDSAAAVLKALVYHPAGYIGGSALALLAGGLFLLAIRGVTWHIPVSVLGSFAVFTLLFGGGEGPVLSQMAGGVVLAAFFMATDPVTSPVSGRGQLVYGVLIGVLTALFQRFLSTAEAVCLGVLLANAAVPVIERRIIPAAR